MNDNQTPFYKLKEIANWQLDSDNSKIELSAMQRGFVWKTSQIETLWDSILRGFPIGSFLLSKSVDKRLFLLDGQQRATSIALGFSDPWHNKQQNEQNNFWSLKNIPIVWIDLAPSEKTNTQKFVIRVVTKSHPWGYQRKDNNSILSVSDRKNALSMFRENPINKAKSYVQFDLAMTFPYDSDLPVPLPFLIKSISENAENWKGSLIQMCKEYLPEILKTKYYDSGEKNYIERITETLNNTELGNDLFETIKDIEKMEIPGIVVEQEILKSEDEQTGEDPTLFVRLNSSGTRIAGEELIYSIYKASFPEAKKLVENIGASFVAPSLVIQLVSRLALAEINNGYPYPINVNDFRKKIKDEKFKNKLIELIGEELNSPAHCLFTRAFDLLLSKNNVSIPPALVKSIVKGSPDLFLMLLHWIKVNGGNATKEEEIKILATITALSWFGRDNVKYVRELWDNISSKGFWSKQMLGTPYLNKKDFIMYPLIQPSTLLEHLLHNVVEMNLQWNNLYPAAESEISTIYKNTLNTEIEQETEIAFVERGMWENFITKLLGCKPLVLFAQREYINQSFGEFNQMETLEDTNTPWDWDHIYPASWVYAKWYIDPNTKHWTNSIGNFRAMSLEENRSENNTLSPQKRLAEVKPQSFIKENDWEFWSKIENQVKEGDNEMIKNHLSAIVHRLCNIYNEWYSTLNVGELFGYENKINQKTYNV